MAASMPRISILRVLLLPLACWLALVLLWLVLPSPPVSWNDEPSEYLWNGGTVTRVYNFVDFFPLNDPLPAVQEARNTGRSAFAVDYTYCPRKGELTISGVPGSDSHSDSELQIVDPSQTSTEETNYYETETETETEPDTTHTSQHAPSHTSHAFHASHSAHATHATHTKYANTYNISALLHSSTLPYISAPFILRAKAGDQDGINLPSFPEADATLLYWEIHRDVAELPLRVRVVNESTVQIWPDSKFWDADRAKGLRNKGDAPTAFPPLLSITFNTTRTIPWADRKTVLTVVDTFVPFRVQFPNPSTEANSSPSQTYAVRRTISALIVPVGILINDYILENAYLPVIVMLRVVQFLAYTLTIYLGVVLACWKLKGSPPFSRFVRSFSLTRPFVVYLARDNPDREWSFEKGERNAGGESGDEAEETLLSSSSSSSSSSHPRPLGSVWDFFSSQSPLDDLLVTFEATRGFVRPVAVRVRFWGSEREDEESGFGSQERVPTRSRSRSRSPQVQHYAESGSRSGVDADDTQASFPAGQEGNQKS